MSCLTEQQIFHHLNSHILSYDFSFKLFDFQINTFSQMHTWASLVAEIVSYFLLAPVVSVGTEEFEEDNGSI